MTPNQAAYNQAVETIKQVANGTRGWVSLTKLAKEAGCEKRHLEAQARLLGLKVEASHGAYGTTAARP